MKKLLLVVLLATAAGVQAAGWQTQKVERGNLAITSVPPKNGMNRAVLIIFEHERKCDPIFSFVEAKGGKFDKYITKYRLNNSKIGVILDDKFYTSHSGIIKYNNGYEASFSIPNELFFKVINANKVTYVTPSGEKVSLITKNLKKSLTQAFNSCVKEFKH